MTTDANLLVVDDNEDNRYTLTRRLNREGYFNLAVATNGREALDLLHSRPFDLILLDIMMPDLNGYDVLAQMKSSVSLREIPVVMISAIGEIDSVIRCIELGAEDYLAKPFNPILLRARIGAILEKKRLRDAVRASLVRLEEELSSARNLQAGMLPSHFPSRTAERPVEVFAAMHPAQEVGGDLFDCFYASERLFCFLVGDVSGKGASAAMFMARTRSLVRMAIDLIRRLSPDALSSEFVAEVVNNELCQNNDARMFVTTFLGLLDTSTGRLSYINAGHPRPHLLHSDGRVDEISGALKPPLGVRADVRYQDQAAQLEPQDTVFVFTDGVFEALNSSGELYTTERLKSLMRTIAVQGPAEIVQTVMASVDEFTGSAPKADDVTALALRWNLSG